MGTKNKPGAFDCFRNLEPDEPYFVLMARDPSAALLVRMWAHGRKVMIEGGEKPYTDMAMVTEALLCADEMEAFATERKARKARPL